MTSITLTDEQLDRLADALANRIAMCLADQHMPTEGFAQAPRLVDAAELARLLGVSRSTVYEHAEEWGGVRIGAGHGAVGERKGRRHGGRRWRFDVEVARAAMSRSTSEPSQGADRPVAAGDQARRPTRRDRRLPARLPEPSSVLPIKPLGAGGRRKSAAAIAPDPSSAG